MALLGSSQLRCYNSSDLVALWQRGTYWTISALCHAAESWDVNGTTPVGVYWDLSSQSKPLGLHSVLQPSCSAAQIDMSDARRQLCWWKLSPRTRMENMDDKSHRPCSYTTTSDPHCSSDDKTRVSAGTNMAREQGLKLTLSAYIVTHTQ